MATIRLTNVPPWDGEYELDFDRAFTTRELRWIKQIANYLPRNFQEGLDGADADLFIALSVIAMQRAGKLAREDVLDAADKLADIPLEEENGRIQIIADDEEGDDALPPASAPEPERSSPRSSPDSSRSSSTDSSGDTEPSGESPETTGATS